MKSELTGITHKKYTAFYIMTGVFLLSLIPLLLIARYNSACADDYTYSGWVHCVWENTHSFAEVIKAAYIRAKFAYTEWQGSFSAVFLFALQPAAFGEKFYCLVPVIMLGGLIFSTLFFCRAFFGKMSGGGLKYIFIAVVWLFAEIQMIPSAVQGFYWFNGASYYTFFYSLSLILFGLMILFVQADFTIKKWIYFAFICILSAVTGGGNYVTALLTVLIFLLCIIGLGIRGNKSALFLTIPFILLLTAFFISITAPGNAVRQAQYISPGVVKTVLDSFSFAFASMTDKVNLMLLPWTVLLFPVLWNTAQDSGWKFRYPLIVLIFTFCLYAAQFAPPVYAMGFVGDERIENIIFYSYMFLLIFNSFYILGWCGRKFACKKFDRIMNSDILPVLLLDLSFVFLAGYNAIPERNVTSVSAVNSLREGEAEKYYEEFGERLKILKDNSAQNVIFLPYDNKPYLLFFDDATDNKDDWRNSSFAKYYGKNSIVVK